MSPSQRDPSSGESAPTTAAEAPELSPETLGRSLAEVGYVSDPRLRLVLFLALRLGKPLLLEGPAGVGKTELARSAALALGRPLIRLQCYEGLDEAKALYEWDYGKQMLYTQLVRGAFATSVAGPGGLDTAMQTVLKSESTFFDRHFLLARPLLQAIESETPAVLLIDEVDRSDPEFEAFLLEVLAEMQVTIPELGTVVAKHPPLVILTTNATREMTEALRRRCLHGFLDYPAPEREIEIIQKKVPGVGEALAKHLAALVQNLRGMDLKKSPSIGESLDFARALVVMNAHQLEPELVRETLGVLLKHQEDRERAEASLSSLLRQ